MKVSKFDSTTYARVQKAAALFDNLQEDEHKVAWDTLVGLDGRLDFLELCCTASSAMATAFEQKGATVARMGLWNGFDLSRHEGVSRARAFVKEKRPRLVWASPPCTVWSTWTQINCARWPDFAKKLLDRNDALGKSFRAFF